MSKKKQKKFKNKKKNTHSGQNFVKKQNTQNMSIEIEKNEIISDIKEIETTKEQEPEDDIYQTDKYEHVKKDIKKILIIMSSIIVVLFATYYLNLKTTYLTTVSDWIYKILNIQA